MSEKEMTELERRSGLRLSNEESNRLTKECIESALVILMKDHAFSSISITDIIKKAGVSRSAYYRNYSSKEDILTNVFQRASDMIVNSLSEPMTQQNKLECYRILFEKVYEYKTLFEIIAKADMVFQFQSSINERYAALTNTESAIQHYRILSWIGSIINIVFGWSARGYEESPECMATICGSFLSEHEWNLGLGIEWRKEDIVPARKNHAKKD